MHKVQCLGTSSEKGCPGKEEEEDGGGSSRWRLQLLSLLHFRSLPSQRSHNMKVRRYARPIPAALLACWPVHFSLQSHGWEGGTGRAGTADAPVCAADQRAAAAASFARILASSRPLTAHTHPSLPHSSTSRTRPPGARKSWKSMTTRNCEWNEKRERGAHFFLALKKIGPHPPSSSTFLF